MTTTHIRSSRILLPALLAACIACSAEDPGGLRSADPDAGEDAAMPAEVRRWVGAVEDSDIRVAAIVEGSRARIFFCGGPSTYETATRWLMVDVGDEGAYEYDQDDLQSRGAVEPTAIRGELSLAGETRPFRAERVAEQTIAGLYEGLADCGRVGLIVTQPTSADEPTAQGACVGPGHLPEQVNPILPIALEAGEIRVDASGMETRVREADLVPR